MLSSGTNGLELFFFAGPLCIVFLLGTVCFALLPSCYTFTVIDVSMPLLLVDVKRTLPESYGREWVLWWRESSASTMLSPQLGLRCRFSLKDTICCFLTIFWMSLYMKHCPAEILEVYVSSGFRLDSSKTTSLTKVASTPLLCLCSQCWYSYSVASSRHRFWNFSITRRKYNTCIQTWLANTENQSFFVLQPQ